MAKQYRYFILGLSLALGQVAACGGGAAIDLLGEGCDEMDATCGQFNVRWELTSQDGTLDGCDALAPGSSVELTFTRPADGATMVETAACDAGTFLTGKVQLGPYAIDGKVVLADGTDSAIAHADITVAAANVIAETTLTFEIVPPPIEGLYESCTTSSTCDAGDQCFNQAYCSPICHELTCVDEQCSNFEMPPASANAACTFDGYDSVCGIPANGTALMEIAWVCGIPCSFAEGECPSGFECQALDQDFNFCLPAT